MATEYIFDARFTEAFFHSPARRVMGMRLLPFSYWHKAQLEFFQNQSIGGQPTLWDLWIAAKICRTRYPVHLNLNQTYSKIWYLSWHACHGWRRLEREASVFWQHVADYASGPKLWAGKGGSKVRLAEAYRSLAGIVKDNNLLQMAAQAEYESSLESKPRDIDDSIEQVAIYVKHGGRSPAEAWNMPMGELLWNNVCLLKVEGADVPIWSPNDEAAFNAHKLNRQKKINEMAKAMRDENPLLTRNLSVAQAAVKYWEDVVAAQSAQTG